MPIQSAQELLIHELHAIEDAEQQASKAMQQLKGTVENDQVQKMLDRRLQQGEQVLQDVRQCLDTLDGSSGQVRNAAARGLIQEAEQLLKEVQAPEMKEAVAIGGMQKLEHYCIATWGTVKALAAQAGEEELSDAMQRAIKEGYDWDKKMTEIAERRVNPAAIKQGQSAKGDGHAAEQLAAGDGASSQSGSQQSASQQSASAQSGSQQSGGGQHGSGGDDLKSREYRGDDGKIHHHTREYMERQGR